MREMWCFLIFLGQLHACATHPDLIYVTYVPTKNYQVTSNSMGVMADWPAQDLSIRGDKYFMEKVRVILKMMCLLVLIFASTKYYQNISNTHTQEFGLEFHSGEITGKQPQQRLSLFHPTRLLVLIYASTKYYQNISNYKEVIHSYR